MDYLVSWVWDDGAGDLRGPVSAAFTTLTGTITVTREEAFALSESQTATTTMPASRAESFALSESLSPQTTYRVTRAESFALTDSQTGALAGEPVNPPWENVVTLLHNDGSGVFTDSSQYNWPITNTSANHGTPAKFGDAAQLFPGYFSIDGTQSSACFWYC